MTVQLGSNAVGAGKKSKQAEADLDSKIKTTALSTSILASAVMIYSEGMAITLFGYIRECRSCK